MSQSKINSLEPVEKVSPCGASRLSVLYTNVATGKSDLGRILSTLPPAQQQRAMAMSAQRQAEYVTGRAILLYYFVNHAQHSDADVCQIIEREGLGPRFVVNDMDIHISISHTKNADAVAFSNKPVGLDIEVQRHKWSTAKAELFCSAEEIVHGEALPKGVQRDEFFTRCWVRKEAFSKWAERSVWSKQTKAANLLNEVAMVDFELAELQHLGAVYQVEPTPPTLKNIVL